MRKWGFGSRLVCARIYSLLAVLHCWLLNGTPLLGMLSSPSPPSGDSPSSLKHQGTLLNACILSQVPCFMRTFSHSFFLLSGYQDYAKN